MITWWTSLSVAMKLLWGITLTASLIFIIQSIMTFLGADTGDTGLDGGLDADVTAMDGSLSDLDGTAGDLGHSGMNLYTFRNLVNFCLGFGWTAILLHDQVASTGLLLVIAILVGVALVALVMYLFKLLSKMQQSGNINIFRAAVGCQGKAYLAIPAERSGSGKVQITINNAVREYDAVTDGAAIPTGTPIKVVEAIDAHTLLVEELTSLII